jgi:hypothetical protein
LKAFNWKVLWPEDGPGMYRYFEQLPAMDFDAMERQLAGGGTPAMPDAGRVQYSRWGDGAAQSNGQGQPH